MGCCLSMGPTGGGWGVEVTTEGFVKISRLGLEGCGGHWHRAGWSRIVLYSRVIRSWGGHWGPPGPAKSTRASSLGLSLSCITWVSLALSFLAPMHVDESGLQKGTHVALAWTLLVFVASWATWKFSLESKVWLFYQQLIPAAVINLLGDDRTSTLSPPLSLGFDSTLGIAALNGCRLMLWHPLTAKRLSRAWPKSSWTQTGTL